MTYMGTTGCIVLTDLFSLSNIEVRIKLEEYKS